MRLLLFILLPILLTSCLASQSRTSNKERLDFDRCWATSATSKGTFSAQLSIYSYGNKTYGFLNSNNCPVEMNIDFVENLSKFRMNDLSGRFGNLTTGKPYSTSPHLTLYGKFEAKYEIQAIGRITETYPEYNIIEVDKILGLKVLQLNELEQSYPINGDTKARNM